MGYRPWNYQSLSTKKDITSADVVKLYDTLKCKYISWLYDKHYSCK